MYITHLDKGVASDSTQVTCGNVSNAANTNLDILTISHNPKLRDSAPMVSAK